MVFFVNTPHNIEGNLNIEIKDPDNFHVKTSIEKLTETIYEIKYIPLKVGSFKILIHYNNVEIRNSPFLARIVNLNKIKTLGEYENFFKPNAKGVNFELNVENCFCFDTSEAGPGKLKEILNL